MMISPQPTMRDCVNSNNQDQFGGLTIRQLHLAHQKFRMLIGVQKMERMEESLHLKELQVLTIWILRLVNGNVVHKMSDEFMLGLARRVIRSDTGTLTFDEYVVWFDAIARDLLCSDVVENEDRTDLEKVGNDVVGGQEYDDKSNGNLGTKKNGDTTAMFDSISKDLEALDASIASQDIENRSPAVKEHNSSMLVSKISYDSFDERAGRSEYGGTEGRIVVDKGTDQEEHLEHILNIDRVRDSIRKIRRMKEMIEKALSIHDDSFDEMSESTFATWNLILPSLEKGSPSPLRLPGGRWLEMWNRDVLAAERRFRDEVDSKWSSDTSSTASSTSERVRSLGSDDLSFHLRHIQPFERVFSRIPVMRKTTLRSHARAIPEDVLLKIMFALARNHGSGNRLLALLCAYDCDFDGVLTEEELFKAMRHFAGLDETDAKRLKFATKGLNGAMQVSAIYQMIACATETFVIESGRNRRLSSPKLERSKARARKRLISRLRKLDFYVEWIVPLIKDFVDASAEGSGETLANSSFSRRNLVRNSPPSKKKATKTTKLKRKNDPRLREEKVKDNRERAVRALVESVKEMVLAISETVSENGSVSKNSLRLHLIKRVDELEFRYADVMASVACAYDSRLGPGDSMVPNLRGSGICRILMGPIFDRFDPLGSECVVAEDFVVGFEIDLRLCVMFDSLVMENRAASDRSHTKVRTWHFRRAMSAGFDTELNSLLFRRYGENAIETLMDSVGASYISYETSCRLFSRPVREPTEMFCPSLPDPTVESSLPDAHVITESYRSVVRETEKKILREVLGADFEYGLEEEAESKEDNVDVPTPRFPTPPLIDYGDDNDGNDLNADASGELYESRGGSTPESMPDTLDNVIDHFAPPGLPSFSDEEDFSRAEEEKTASVSRSADRFVPSPSDRETLDDDMVVVKPVMGRFVPLLPSPSSSLDEKPGPTKEGNDKKGGEAERKKNMTTANRSSQTTTSTSTFASASALSDYASLNRVASAAIQAATNCDVKRGKVGIEVVEEQSDVGVARGNCMSKGFVERTADSALSLSQLRRPSPLSSSSSLPPPPPPPPSTASTVSYPPSPQWTTTSSLPSSPFPLSEEKGRNHAHWIRMRVDQDERRLEDAVGFLFSVAERGAQSNDRLSYAQLMRVSNHPVYRVRTDEMKEILRRNDLKFDEELLLLCDDSCSGHVTLRNVVGGVRFVFRLREIFCETAIDEAVFEEIHGGSFDPLISDASQILGKLRSDFLCMQHLKNRGAEAILAVLERLVVVKGSRALVTFPTFLECVRRPYKDKTDWEDFESRLESACDRVSFFNGAIEDDETCLRDVKNETGEDDRKDASEIFERESSTNIDLAIFDDVVGKINPLWDRVRQIFDAVEVDACGLASIDALKNALYNNGETLKRVGGLLWSGPLGLSYYAGAVFERWASFGSKRRINPGTMRGALMVEQELRHMWAETAITTPGARLSYGHRGAGDWHKDRKRGKELFGMLRGRKVNQKSLYLTIIALTNRTPDFHVRDTDYFSAVEFARRINRPLHGMGIVH